MNPRSNLSVGLIIIFLALSVIVTAADDPSYSKDLEKWRADRLEEINGEDGWTTLVGLFWLNEGQNKFGSDPSNEIVLPRTAPKVAGSVRLNHGVVTLEAKPDAGITSDANAVSTL